MHLHTEYAGLRWLLVQSASYFGSQTEASNSAHALYEELTCLTLGSRFHSMSQGLKR